MAKIRVYVPTYRRHRNLRRALSSLIAQTRTDWVCEVHNDDPVDPIPGEIVKALADPRILYSQHARNLGTVQSFNLFYQTVSETYISILEDDSWWEPKFLEILGDLLDEHRLARMAWCNQRLWREENGGNFVDTGDVVRELRTFDHYVPYGWGGHEQAMGFYHSNGAMMLRIRGKAGFATPRVPVGGMESIRERMMEHPILFVPKCLAHFAQTKTSARDRDRDWWLAWQTCLLATFVKHCDWGMPRLKELWGFYSSQRPIPVGQFICAGLIEPKCRSLLVFPGVIGFLRFIVTACRHPICVARALLIKQFRPDWWEPLDRYTKQRFEETSLADQP